ncbi:MAG: hypothetical protein JRI68_04445 [Deltaproteobacteria bacterium]|nr:hypothetical protein [Deltaproteobacteria bacterium]
MAGQTITRASGVGLIEQDGKLYAVDLGTGWAYTMGFVLGLITFIFGAFGTVQLVLAIAGAGGLAVLGAIFVPIAAATGVGLWLVVRHVQRRHAAPLGSLPVIVVFDFAAGQLCAATGQPLAPLAQVQLGHKLQLGSSSKALELRWPGGSVALVRGNPFAGGSSAIEDALGSRGLGVG